MLQCCGQANRQSIPGGSSRAAELSLQSGSQFLERYVNHPCVVLQHTGKVAVRPLAVVDVVVEVVKGAPPAANPLRHAVNTTILRSDGQDDTPLAEFLTDNFSAAVTVALVKSGTTPLQNIVRARHLQGEALMLKVCVLSVPLKHML